MVRTSERGSFMKRREGILASHALLLLRHALSISLLILRKNPTVLQSKCESFVRRSKGGAMVKALASHQCGQGSNPSVDTMCNWVCSWFSPLLWVVFFGHSGFPLASKPNISNPSWTRNARPRISTLMCYISIFIYFINFINTLLHLSLEGFFTI